MRFAQRKVDMRGQDAGRIIDMRSMRTAPGMKARGTKALYRVLALREYDEDGALVDIGSESDPLDAGHSLQWTIDVPRMVD